MPCSVVAQQCAGGDGDVAGLAALAGSDVADPRYGARAAGGAAAPGVRPTAPQRQFRSHPAAVWSDLSRTLSGVVRERQLCELFLAGFGAAAIRDDGRAGSVQLSRFARLFVMFRRRPGSSSAAGGQISSPTTPGNVTRRMVRLKRPGPSIRSEVPATIRSMPW